MKNRFFLLLVILVLVFGNLHSQTVTISGKIRSMPNPCLTIPCLPDVVFAIKTDSINYIIVLQNQWAEPPLIIEGHTFDVGDFITAEGIVSVKQDIYGEDYYEIDIMSVIVSIDDDFINQNSILIFPNPTKGYINIESKNKPVKNIEIITMEGKQLLNCKYSVPSSFIHINNIDEKGILILRILLIDDTQIIKKLIVL